MPFVNPPTVSGLAMPLAVTCTAPAAHVPMYSVTAAVPVSAGGVNAIFADAFPGVASPMVGASGARGSVLGARSRGVGGTGGKGDQAKGGRGARESHGLWVVGRTANVGSGMAPR